MEPSSKVEGLSSSADFELALASSSTNRRKAALVALNHELQTSSMSYPLGFLRLLTSDQALALSACSAAIEALIKTYPFYNDRASRKAVRECLRSLLSNPFYSESAKDLFEAFQTEASKAGLAASNAFVLVEWGSEFIQQCAAQDAVWKNYGQSLIIHHARILERCMSSETRHSVKQSALVVTRRALRKLFRASQIGETAVKDVVIWLTAKAQGASAINAVFLGVVAAVCARLESQRLVLEANKSLYHTFYLREMVGSRSPVPHHIVTAYNDFFISFMTQEDLQRELVPALEKALLRAPEVVLNDLISPMVQSLPSSIDVSKPLAEHLLKPILANLKSQSPIIRNGAMSTFKTCLTHSYDSKYLQKITDDILDPLESSKLSVAEQRTLYSRMIGFLPYDEMRSASICTSLAAVVSKEPNETALSVETAALAQHCSSLLSTGGTNNTENLGRWTAAFAKGLCDKRSAVRKSWILRTGEILWQLNNQSANTKTVSNFTDAVVPKLWDCFDEVTTNLHASAVSGLSVAAYVVVATYDIVTAKALSEPLKTQGRKMKIQDLAFSTDQKSSIFNHRIYTKLSGDDEIRWAIRALSVIRLPNADTSPSSPPSVEDGWALTFLYFITSALVSSTLRKEAATALRDVYCSQPRIVSRLIIRGLWIWHSQVENLDKDTPATLAKTGSSNLYLAVRSICPPRIEASNSSFHVDAEVLRPQLIDMLILARPDIVPRVNWIDLCLGLGQDPGDLARSNVDRIIQMLTADQPSAAVSLAAYKAAAELAFVCPNIITPKLTKYIHDSLPADEVSKYGSTEVAIARTPEGTAFVDVLSSKGPGRVLEKNSRDYETLKWEEEVRSQQARKKGQEKKLTADEKAKIDSQLTKEAKIRREVLDLERRLRKGIGFIHALATGPPTEAVLWLGPCLEALLGVIAAGAGLMVGNEANEAYIACSNLVSSRLGSLRPFIAVATLRSLDSAQLPEQLSQEPLGGM